MLVGLRMRRPLSDAAVYDKINAEVVKAVDFYGKHGWLARPEGFFAAPPAPTEVSIRTFGKGNRKHERMSFDSGYTPYAREPGRQRWLSYPGNRREYALMLRHSEPRPCWCASTGPRWAA